MYYSVHESELDRWSNRGRHVQWTSRHSLNTRIHLDFRQGQDGVAGPGLPDEEESSRDKSRLTDEAGRADRKLPGVVGAQHER